MAKVVVLLRRDHYVDDVRYVVLLRGINVGGHRKVPMVTLRGLLEAAGFEDVSTYIQSGNVVLTSDDDETTVSSRVAAAIETEFGFDVRVVAFDADAFQSVVDACPYLGGEPDHRTVHAVLFEEAPGDVSVAGADLGGETFQVEGRAIYLYLPDGMGRAELPVQISKATKDLGTARNWRTMSKLVEMLDS